MTLTFNAIDVETANTDLSSICAIGIVHVRDGEITDRWYTLVNPETDFFGSNVSVHGISESDVIDSPTLPEIRAELRNRLRGSVLVSHSHFDRSAFEQAMLKYDLEPLQVTWLDSVMVARRAWPEKYGVRGAGLKRIADDLDISFQHHNALEDARVAAVIMLHACAATNLDISDWLRRVKEPVFSSEEHRALAREAAPKKSSKNVPGNPDGPLFGETIVFTGAMSMPRAQAQDISVRKGCNVSKNVSTKMTLLVVGDYHVGESDVYVKTGKHRATDELIEQGLEIKILSENDFKYLIESC